MDTRMMERCELLVKNRQVMQAVYGWDSGMMHLCAAAMYAMRGVTAQEERVRRCKALIKERVGMFSNFRSISGMALSAMMDLSGDPEKTLDDALTIYSMLKEHFFTSEYLPVASMLIAQGAHASRWEEIAAQTRTIYDRMKKEHPWLTGSDDCAYCALMAMTGRNVDEMIEEMEAIYTQTKATFSVGNGTQALSHALTLCTGAAQEKAARTAALYEAFKQRGQRWGREFELSALGLLAMASHAPDDTADAVLEISEWLSGQKGFGFWGSVTRTMRLMYAGMMFLSVQGETGEASDVSAVTGTMAAVIAQQAATLAAISASSAAAASASHG